MSATEFLSTRRSLIPYIKPTTLDKSVPETFHLEIRVLKFSTKNGYFEFRRTTCALKSGDFSIHGVQVSGTMLHIPSRDEGMKIKFDSADADLGEADSCFKCYSWRLINTMKATLANICACSKHGYVVVERTSHFRVQRRALQGLLSCEVVV